VSLQINMSKISAVLLGNQWHDVVPETFGIDAYELGSYYPSPDYASGFAFSMHHGGGESGVCSTGFAFQSTEGTWVSGPLTAIQAVKGDRITKDPV
jgi:hypothetical protein